MLINILGIVISKGICMDRTKPYIPPMNFKRWGCGTCKYFQNVKFCLKQEKELIHGGGVMNKKPPPKSKTPP